MHSFKTRAMAQMEMLCEDLLTLICKTLISQSNFQLLMVSKNLRALMQPQILKELETILHISQKITIFVSEHQHAYH